MPLLWIHRATVADIFIPIGYFDEARVYTKRLLMHNSPDDHNMFDVDMDELNFTGNADLGCSPNLQVSYISNTYVPNEGWEFWNDDGYIMSNKEEAIMLGSNGVPDGFIAGESSIPWVKEVRTHKELDAELDDYMGNNSLSPIITRLKAMFGF
jgi:hypothetical protein